MLVTLHLLALRTLATRIFHQHLGITMDAEIAGIALTSYRLQTHDSQTFRSFPIR